MTLFTIANTAGASQTQRKPRTTDTEARSSAPLQACLSQGTALPHERPDFLHECPVLQGSLSLVLGSDVINRVAQQGPKSFHSQDERSYLTSVDRVIAGVRACRSEEEKYWLVF